MTPDTASAVDFGRIKERQQAMWRSGDFSVIATQIQPVAERLVDVADPAAGSKVLDVAGGSGNAAIAAARCDCVVLCTDYVAELLGRGRERAAAEGLDIAFEEADAENLPYDDSSFDTVVSVFGCMFAPDQARTASELVRVCRPGGSIALANWTREGFVGELFHTIAHYVPRPAGVASPLLWGDEHHVDGLLADAIGSRRATRQIFTFRTPSPEAFVERFRRYYGPVAAAFASLDESRAQQLRDELVDLLRRHDRRGDGPIAVPAEYLEYVALRRDEEVRS